MNPLQAQKSCWMLRLVTRRPAATGSSSLMHTRIEVCPPELWPSSLSWQGRLRRLGDRLLAQALPWLPAPVRPVNRLTMAQQAFQSCLADLSGPGANLLRDRIVHARSLRELWHLRLPVYREVSLAHSQSEAEDRLAGLNRHFPTRAPRSGLMPAQR